MANIRTIVRCIVCGAGVAAAIAAVPALAEWPTGTQTLAQPVDCSTFPSNTECNQNNMIYGPMPGTMPGIPGAPNLQTGGGQDSQQHSGNHH